MNKHPGIWYTLWVLEVSFLLGILLGSINIARQITGSIVFAWCALSLWGAVYYNMKWVQKIDKKYYKLDDFDLEARLNLINPESNK